MKGLGFLSLGFGVRGCPYICIYGYYIYISSSIHIKPLHKESANFGNCRTRNLWYSRLHTMSEAPRARDELLAKELLYLHGSGFGHWGVRSMAWDSGFSV